MKKLLVLFLATLVIGMAFSGPVRNNGPGSLMDDSVEITLIEEQSFTEIYLPNIQITNTGAIATAVLGIPSEISQGNYFIETLGVSGSPFYIPAALTADPYTCHGDISQSQEVIARLGRSKPMNPGETMMLIMT